MSGWRVEQVLALVRFDQRSARGYYAAWLATRDAKYYRMYCMALGRAVYNAELVTRL